jgi:hypothetical protein
VFYWWSFYGVNTVELVGVLWGGPGTGNTSTVSYISPMSQVQNDLGALNLQFAPGWMARGELANDVGVGADGTAWIITNTSTAGGYTIQRLGGHFLTPGGALRIAVDPVGNAWVVNNTNQIYKWNGSYFQLMPGLALDIGIGSNGSIWVIGNDHQTYYWNGSNWTLVSGSGVHIAVDTAGNPWITASDLTIWHRVSGVWQQVGGTGTDVAVAPDGMVWVVGTAWQGDGYDVYWWNGLNWVRAPGSAVAVSADRGGRPWVVNAFNQLFQAL